jgi:hypothetical protein
MINLRVRGVEQLKDFFAALSVEMRKIAVREVAEYLIGDDNHGLKHLVKYKYVSRKKAYGQTFVSDKQRRFVMAAIKDGRIKPGQNNRTGATSEGWDYKTTGGGYGAQIYNGTQGAKYVQGDDTQARQPALVGHRKVTDVISTNIKGAILRAEQALQRWINSKGMG